MQPNTGAAAFVVMIKERELIPEKMIQNIQKKG